MTSVICDFGIENKVPLRCFLSLKASIKPRLFAKCA